MPDDSERSDTIQIPEDGWASPEMKTFLERIYCEIATQSNKAGLEGYECVDPLVGIRFQIPEEGWAPAEMKAALDGLYLEIATKANKAGLQGYECVNALIGMDVKRTMNAIKRPKRKRVEIPTQLRIMYRRKVEAP